MTPSPRAVAFEDGRQACLAGANFSSNPYRATDWASAWSAGYQAAEVEEAEGAHFRTPTPKKETR